MMSSHTFYMLAIDLFINVVNKTSNDFQLSNTFFYFNDQQLKQKKFNLLLISEVKKQKLPKYSVCSFQSKS